MKISRFTIILWHCIILVLIFDSMLFRDEDAELDDGEGGGGGVDASYGGGDSSDSSSESSADTDDSFGDSD
jgi:hypothetical protein